METGIKSSFIPHEMAPLPPSSSSRPSGVMDLLTLVAVVALVASAALAAGVFLYLQFLKTESASKLEQLERAKAAFEPSLIQEIARLDDRMRAASSILSGHIAPSVLFKVLEQVTLQSISFESLDFDATSAQPTIQMRGIAGSVNAIALQADLLNKSGTITNPIFSNIAREVNGVRFDLSASVNTAALNFVQLVNTAASQTAGAAASQQAPQNSSAPQDPFGGSGTNTP